MTNFMALRDIAPPDEIQNDFGPQDCLVVFGELFARGYANGIVDEAQKRGMKLVFSTVGRRGERDELRPLTHEELNEKALQPIINIPLEAGFDLEPDSQGQRPVDQLQGLKLSEWDKAKINWDSLNESRSRATERFRQNLRHYLKELQPHIESSRHVVFVHTMAGGVPRAKIAMPAMNRVFKGHGDRYASSEEFWGSDLGRFCAANFEDVTANTFAHLVELSTELRESLQRRGGRVSYVAYGYHGTEVLMGQDYKWQSYSPYLQGFAKLKLEGLAQEAWTQGVRATVFNAPEILTNSSSIFLGVEVSLYPLLGALQKESGQDERVQLFLKSCQSLLKPEHSFEEIMDYTGKYFSSETIQKWSQFAIWPQHNGPEQMALMREVSSHLINMHRDSKQMMTAELSELVFRATGLAMIQETFQPKQPVWWMGHDLVARLAPRLF